MSVNSFPRALVEYLWKSNIHFNFRGDHFHFNLNCHYVTVHRLTAKTWAICCLFHTYYFTSQLELIEWLEDQRDEEND
nr:MAG TPA: hypothetical protein [Caudoviricetes sp.]